MWKLQCCIIEGQFTCLKQLKRFASVLWIYLWMPFPISSWFFFLMYFITINHRKSHSFFSQKHHISAIWHLWCGLCLLCVYTVVASGPTSPLLFLLQHAQLKHLIVVLLRLYWQIFSHVISTQKPPFISWEYLLNCSFVFFSRRFFPELGECPTTGGWKAFLNQYLSTKQHNA